MNLLQYRPAAPSPVLLSITVVIESGLGRRPASGATEAMWGLAPAVRGWAGHRRICAALRRGALERV